MMKVFIGWSGPRSKAVAQALHDWLPDVIHILKPWMSSADLDKGRIWPTEISKELKESGFGIICLTPENLQQPWIYFEAGAISKSVEHTYVCPLLFDLDGLDQNNPLNLFQTTKAEKDDIKSLIKTMNNALGDAKLDDARLNKSFENNWKELEDKLDQIRKNSQQQPKS